jgi:hypothetical protein
VAVGPVDLEMRPNPVAHRIGVVTILPSCEGYSMFFVYAKISASTARIVAADIVGYDGKVGSLAAFNDWANAAGYTEFSGEASRPAWMDRATGSVVAWVMNYEDRAYAAACAYGIKDAARAAAIAYSYSAGG